MGLNIAIEEFDFESYEIDKMQLRLGGTDYLPFSIAFNPYAGVFNFEGQAILLDPQDLSSGRALPDIENNHVISTQRADFFRLMSMKPQLIVYVTPSEFNGLKAAGDHHFELKIDGHGGAGTCPQRHLFSSSNRSAVLVVSRNATTKFAESSAANWKNAEASMLKSYTRSW